MTNDELFARQLANLNQGLRAVALVLYRHLEQQYPGPGEPPDPLLQDLNKAMQDFHDMLATLQQLVTTANQPPSGIILPN